jgi:hypothetical protein
LVRRSDFEEIDHIADGLGLPRWLVYIVLMCTLIGAAWLLETKVKRPPAGGAMEFVVAPQGSGWLVAALESTRQAVPGEGRFRVTLAVEERRRKLGFGYSVEVHMAVITVPRGLTGGQARQLSLALSPEMGDEADRAWPELRAGKVLRKWNGGSEPVVVRDLWATVLPAALILGGIVGMMWLACRLRPTGGEDSNHPE